MCFIIVVVSVFKTSYTPPRAEVTRLLASLIHSSRRTIRGSGLSTSTTKLLYLNIYIGVYCISFPLFFRVFFVAH